MSTWSSRLAGSAGILILGKPFSFTAADYLELKIDMDNLTIKEKKVKKADKKDKNIRISSAFLIPSSNLSAWKTINHIPPVQQKMIRKSGNRNNL